jgi:hypothetical protein
VLRLCIALHPLLQEVGQRRQWPQQQTLLVLLLLHRGWRLHTLQKHCPHLLLLLLQLLQALSLSHPGDQQPLHAGRQQQLLQVPRLQCPRSSQCHCLPCCLRGC